MKNRSANNQNATASMVVRMTPEMKLRLEKTALSEGLSAAELIRRAIQRELDAHERGVDTDDMTAALLKALDDPDVCAVLKEKLKD